MNNEELFVSIIDKCRENETAPKLSSKIKQWLGRDISQSLCIRIGNYLEPLFRQVTSTEDDLKQLDEFDNYRGIWSDNEFHQIDFIKITPSCVFQREIKTNLDLDRGKKRDTLKREVQIVKALQAKFMRPVNSCIFSPFLDKSRKTSGLGIVEGLPEFLALFDATITVEEFKALGRSPQVYNALTR